LAAANPPVLRPADDGPVFHSLFHAGERREPVAPAVSKLWNTQSSAATTGTAVTTAARPGEPLDLFQNMQPDVRGLFGAKS
jgi:hypothetical protein